MIYTLRDLQKNNFPESAKLAVIGHPIAHSRSPQMQTAALQSVGKKDITYIAIEFFPHEFETGIALLREKNFIGTNITIPYKRNAFELSDCSDALASACQAANTLIFNQSNSRPIAFNTDGPGFRRAVEEIFQQKIQNRHVIILGAAGGAGSAIAFACAQAQAGKIWLVNRTPGKLTKLIHQIAQFKIPCEELRFDSPELENQFLSKNEALVINATSLGLKPNDPSPIPSDWLHENLAVFDTLTHETALQREARAKGARVSDGLPMLVWQGALSFQHWFGILPDTEAMFSSLRA